MRLTDCGIAKKAAKAINKAVALLISIMLCFYSSVVLPPSALADGSGVPTFDKNGMLHPSIDPDQVVLDEPKTGIEENDSPIMTMTEADPADENDLSHLRGVEELVEKAKEVIRTHMNDSGLILDLQKIKHVFDPANIPAGTISEENSELPLARQAGVITFVSVSDDGRKSYSVGIRAGQLTLDEMTSFDGMGRIIGKDNFQYGTDGIVQYETHMTQKYAVDGQISHSVTEWKNSNGDSGSYVYRNEFDVLGNIVTQEYQNESQSGNYRNRNESVVISVYDGNNLMDQTNESSHYQNGILINSYSGKLHQDYEENRLISSKNFYKGTSQYNGKTYTYTSEALRGLRYDTAGRLVADTTETRSNSNGYVYTYGSAKDISRDAEGNAVHEVTVNKSNDSETSKVVTEREFLAEDKPVSETTQHLSRGVLYYETGTDFVYDNAEMLVEKKSEAVSYSSGKVSYKNAVKEVFEEGQIVTNESESYSVQSGVLKLAGKTLQSYEYAENRNLESSFYQSIASDNTVAYDVERKYNPEYSSSSPTSGYALQAAEVYYNYSGAAGMKQQAVESGLLSVTSNFYADRTTSIVEYRLSADGMPTHQVQTELARYNSGALASRLKQEFLMEIPPSNSEMIRYPVANSDMTVAGSPNGNYYSWYPPDLRPLNYREEKFSTDGVTRTYFKNLVFTYDQHGALLSVQSEFEMEGHALRTLDRYFWDPFGTGTAVERENMGLDGRTKSSDFRAVEYSGMSDSMINQPLLYSQSTVSGGLRAPGYYPEYYPKAPVKNLKTTLKRDSARISASFDYMFDVDGSVLQAIVKGMFVSAEGREIQFEAVLPESDGMEAWMKSAELYDFLHSLVPEDNPLDELKKLFIEEADETIRAIEGVLKKLSEESQALSARLAAESEKYHAVVHARKDILSGHITELEVLAEPVSANSVADLVHDFIGEVKRYLNPDNPQGIDMLANHYTTLKEQVTLEPYQLDVAAFREALERFLRYRTLMENASSLNELEAIKNEKPEIPVERTKEPFPVEDKNPMPGLDNRMAQAEEWIESLKGSKDVQRQELLAKLTSMIEKYSDEIATGELTG